MTKPESYYDGFSLCDFCLTILFVTIYSKPTLNWLLCAWSTYSCPLLSTSAEPHDNAPRIATHLS